MTNTFFLFRFILYKLLILMMMRVKECIYTIVYHQRKHIVTFLAYQYQLSIRKGPFLVFFKISFKTPMFKSRSWNMQKLRKVGQCHYLLHAYVLFLHLIFILNSLIVFLIKFNILLICWGFFTTFCIEFQYSKHKKRIK